MNPPNNYKNWLIVVPARLCSSRLPRKPLQDLAGKPLVIRVAENLEPLRKAGAELIVAIDDQEVAEVLSKAGISYKLTRTDHASGTDRCWEIAAKYEHPFILNVQGDEPFIDTNDLSLLMSSLEQHRSADIATLVYSNSNTRQLDDPNIVKAIRTKDGFALYFTRSPAPYHRDGKALSFWQHLGVYAFRREALQHFCRFDQSPLEKIERLEQLRALENHMKIFLTEAKVMTHGIDTLEDLDAARARF